MEFDPRDFDARDDDGYNAERERGSRAGSDDDRDWDDWRQPETARRERDDARALGSRHRSAAPLAQARYAASWSRRPTDRCHSRPSSTPTRLISARGCDRRSL
jgi:hypothetical protein